MSPRFNANNRQEKGKSISARKASDTNPEQEPPIFCLRFLSKDYCLSKCTKDEKSAFADTIFKLSQLTWSEINSSGRHGLGYEKIARDSLKAAVPKHVTDDVNFIAFRFCAKAPMVGYRDRAVFHVLWLDRNFTLYNH
ncbi:hypothetical protein H6G17_09195 [Chroococcidiopsis sp. FACHB-1243]|uniref:hypothetical protein n=1 Tax=Chroococcidiopsis sp. [FACHB-1243] TaxID=2692781 RepID=UPI00177C7C12|nr:hypothetical protein [Chroococcidiopsis sp. [FACHB-1243]]MBD2305687.1 hypothetical protein [Chroococcidiopsis sp. [FACHB-1243]]